ncbi:hypothetical protein AAVH_02215 [Aphelenchoides avenae]|nr:hypothetical protein AAVH_02215 [Aphelenchus avenae]
MEADSAEVRYRIQLGTTVDGTGIWQFNDAENLETFVTLFLSIRTLWNKQYPLAAQACLLDDRFVKFVPVFDAISTIVLYGAYEEIVARRNWSDSRPFTKEPKHVIAQTTTVPLARMSSQDAYANVAGALAKIAKCSGKAPEDLVAGALARLITMADQEDQIDEVSLPAQVHVGNPASPEAASDDPFAPNSYEVEESRVFLRKQEELQDRLEASGYRLESPARSAYREGSSRYSPVFMEIPQPLTIGCVNLHNSTDTELGTPVKKPPTPIRATSPSVKPAREAQSEVDEYPISRSRPSAAPPTKIRKLDAVCVNTATAPDDPTSAKSDDSGVSMSFDFASATDNDALRPAAADAPAVDRTNRNPRDTVANLLGLGAAQLPLLSPKVLRLWDDVPKTRFLSSDSSSSSNSEDEASRHKVPRLEKSNNTSATGSKTLTAKGNGLTAYRALTTKPNLELVQKKCPATDNREYSTSAAPSSSTAGRVKPSEPLHLLSDKDDL